MAIKPKDIYDGRKKKRSPGAIITLVIILIIALVIGLFYWLQSLCVYDDEGNANIVFPFTKEAREIKKAQSEEPNSPESSGTPPDDYTQSVGSTSTPEESGTQSEDGTPENSGNPSEPTVPPGIIPTE